MEMMKCSATQGLTIVLGHPDSLLVLNAATIEERNQHSLDFQFEQNMVMDAGDVL